jgi:hypothetical protein
MYEYYLFLALQNTVSHPLFIKDFPRSLNSLK